MYRITSPYGIRTRPNTNRKEFTSGIDLVSKDNSVRPLQNGTIINIGVQGDGRPGFKDPSKYKELGYYIDMQGDDGLFYRFGHVDPIKNKDEFIGRKVQAGEPLWSYAKGSGSGTGPHMKMYVSEDSSFRKKIDPTQIVNEFIKNPTKPNKVKETQPVIAENRPSEPNPLDEIGNQLARLGQNKSYELPNLQSQDEILAAYREMVGDGDQSSAIDSREAMMQAQQQERASIEAQQRQIALSQRQHDENRARERQALEKDINDRMFANFSSGMNNLWSSQQDSQDEPITLPSQKNRYELPDELKPNYGIAETPRFSEGQSYLG